MDRLAGERLVHGLEEFVGRRRRLHVRAVIVIARDRKLLGKFPKASEMVAVPVRDDQMIDLGDTGVFRRFDDASGIARRLGAAIAGIDEHSLAEWRDEQRGVAAFNVDDVNLQRFGGAALRKYG